MKISYLKAFTDNYIWIITDMARGQFACVDPGDAQPVITFAEQHKLTLKTVLLTHHHHDHVGGVLALKKTFADLQIYGPKDAKLPYVNAWPNTELQIALAGQQLKVIPTPGHTASHISYFEPVNKLLFCGDTLFSAGCGRVFDGTIESLYHSLETYRRFPDATLIYCAHEYTLKNLRFARTVEPHNQAIKNLSNILLASDKLCSLPSTIGLEKQINPFFRVTEPAVKEYAKAHGVNTADALAVFAYLRSQKDNF